MRSKTVHFSFEVTRQTLSFVQALLPNELADHPLVRFLILLIKHKQQEMQALKH